LADWFKAHTDAEGMVTEEVALFGTVLFGKAKDGAAADAALAGLFARARSTVFPTLAEGCGLPLIESLWRGVPCVASDLPVLRENATGGGCVLVAPDDPAAWRAALRRVLTDDGARAALVREATTRPLPTWREAAATLRMGLGQADTG
jgi:glycosyltransferase involved in cell wall biosynthesis